MSIALSHIYVIGKTGVGKTTLLETLFAQTFLAALVLPSLIPTATSQSDWKNLSLRAGKEILST